MPSMLPPASRAISALRPAAVMAAALAALLHVAPARADSPAESFVKDLSAKTFSILRDHETPLAQREGEFRKLFVSHADLKRISAFALGQYVRTPTADQRRAYVKLLEQFIVKVYFSRLQDYANEKLVVTGSREKGRKNREVLVSSAVSFSDGRQPVQVEWWLLREDGGFRIFDVRVAGIWMTQEQRSAFVSVIRDNNGNFDALLAHLRSQISGAAKT